MMGLKFGLFVAVVVCMSCLFCAVGNPARALPVADFTFDIEPLGIGKGEFFPVIFRCESIHFEDLSYGTEGGETINAWYWEIIDAADHSSVVITSDLQNPVFHWNDLAPYFDEPLADHWYDVSLTAYSSVSGSDTVTREYQFMTVPEPASLLLMASGLLGAVGVLRKRLR